MTGKFITLEGLEGSGKSTHAAKIANYLRQQGIEVHLTQEPGGTQLGEEIRQWLLEPTHQLSEMTELLLFYAARAQHIEQRIKPALHSGSWVVCDRFMDSSYAYQGGGCQLPLEYIKQLNQLTVSIEPDLSLLLDMDPNYMLQRINPDNLDRFEREDIVFFERVRAAYLQCAQNAPNRIKIINAEQEIDHVMDEIIKNLEPLIETA